MPPGPQTDGSVNVTYRQGGVQYVGGSFTQVGTPTGAAALLPGPGDTPNPAFPKVTGTVNCSAPDGAGGWYLGGSFTQVGGVAKQNLVHVTSANAVDASFGAGANATVRALLLNAGTLYIGGDFTTLSGLPRKYLGALDASTGAVQNFDPNLDGPVNTLALNGTRLLAGGQFQRVGGSLCPNIAAFSTATGARVTHTQADGQVTALVVDGTTTYAGGAFQGFGYNTGYSTLLGTASDVPAAGWPFINGTVNTTVPDGSGGWYVGGSFSQVGGANWSNLAHIRADNTLDPNFGPAPNGTVSTLLLNGTTLYVGGDFTIVGGAVRNRLAALDATTGAATTFNPNLNSRPNALARLGTALYVGGGFSSAQGAPARNLAAYDLSTGLRMPYPGTSGAVNALLVDGTTLFVGGQFSSVGFYTGYSAQLSTTSDAPTANWPVINGTVYATASDGSGGWYVGGAFSQVGNINRNNLVHITAANTVDLSFNPNPNSSVQALLVSGGTLYAGGQFTTIGGQPRYFLAALNAATGAATSLDLGTGNTVRSLALIGTTLYAGGDMVQTQSLPTRYLVALNTSTGAVVPTIGTNSSVQDLLADGPTLYIAGSHTQTGIPTGTSTLLTTSNDQPSSTWPFVYGTVYTTIPDGSGGWFVGGSFTSLGTLPRRNLAHVLANNTVDPAFAPDPNSTVQALVLQGGTLYVGGSFNQIGGQTRPYLAAVSPTTGAALAPFDAAANSTVNTLVASGTTLYAGGSFSSIGGQSRAYLAGLDLTTGVATAWNPAANSTVTDLAFDATVGTLYVGGSFSNIGGASRQYLASFATATNTLNAFNPSPNSTVLALALAGSNLYVGGYFSAIGGQSRQYLAAVDKTTGLATTFNPRPNSSVNAVVTDGTTLFTGGNFTLIGTGPGTARNYLAAYTLSTGALTTWDPSANSAIDGLATDGSGIVAFGSSLSLLKVAANRPYLAALNTGTGQVDAAFNPSPNSTVMALAVVGSTLYAGGNYSTIGGLSRQYLAAVSKTTGAGVAAFNPQPNSPVYALATDGTTLFVGGTFTSVGTGPSTVRNRLAAFALSTGALTGWDPNADGTVETLSLNGSTVVAGGSFNYLKYQTQNGLVALDAATGSANTGFVANFNYASYYGYAPQVLAMVGSTLYVGGNLYYFNGSPVSNILGLNKTTGALSGFAPTVNGTVTGLATDGTTLFAGGNFSQAGGSPRNNLAAFTLGTGALTAWNPNANSTVQALALSGTAMVAGGSFNYLNYQTKARLASLTSTGQVNTAFSPPSFSSYYGSPASSMVVSGSRLYVAGDFYYYTNSNGASRNQSSVNSFDKTTGFDDGSFTVAFGSYGQAQALATDGTTLYVGGTFTQVGTAAGSPQRNRLAAFNLSTAALTGWDPSLNNTVYTLARNGSDVLAGGNFTLGKALNRNGLFAYSVRTGQVLSGFNANFSNGPVYALVAVGSKLYVGGGMYTYNSSTGYKGGLFALNNLTGADTGFNAALYSQGYQAGSAPVISLAATASTVYVGGGFYSGYGSPRNYLAAYDVASDALVSGFNPAPNATVRALTLDGSTLYTGGDFTTIAGQTRNRLAAFATGSNALTAWNPSANSSVYALGVNSTAVYAGGFFTNAGGQPRNYAAALDKTTAAATTWNPNLNNGVYGLTATDTRVIAGGVFTQAGSLSAGRTAVFGPVASTPVFVAQLDNKVDDFTLSADTLLVGGDFLTANGQSRAYLASFTLPATPTISSFTPAFGPVGTVVTVTGSGFTGATGVTLNGTAATTFSVVGATQLTFTVPAGATTGLIAITTPLGTGTSLTSFTVTPAVTITSFSPLSGKVGDGVTITGTGFTGATAVRFNGVAAVSPSVSSTSIFATVPAGATTGPISVVAPGGTAASATDYVVVPAPTITSFSPTSGVAGTAVTLTGTNFGGASQVLFNGTGSNFTLVSATTITATVPYGATTGLITVVTPGGTAASASSFTVVPLPSISYFSPTSGPVGTTVDLFGYYFTGATQVLFNGTSATYTVVSATNIRAIVPTGATDGLIKVTTPTGTGTSGSIFTVTPSVVVSYGYGPNSTYNAAAVGNVVTVYGSGFTGATGVSFNGTAGTNITVTGNTQLTVTVPAGATTGPISVTTPAGTGVQNSDFTIIPAPTITSLSPSFGTVNSYVTIYGTGFANGGTVTFSGGVNSTYISGYGPGYITAYVPTGASTGPITVTTLGGTATSATPFTVVGAPIITGFSPTSGLPGTSVNVTGTNLNGTTQLYFNNSSATFSGVTSTGLTAVVPAGATTGRITVYTPAGSYTTTTDFTVLSLTPTITSFTPASGPVGTGVTVTGTNFSTLTGITVGGITVTSYTIQSPTSVYFIVPNNAVSGPIVITNPSGTATSATNFAVMSITSFTPTSGVVGDVVTITGVNLQNATVVAFNGTNAPSFTVNGAGTSITVTVPAGATTGAIRVTGSAGTVYSNTSFTVLAPMPSITSFTPGSGPVNTAVTITGTDFTNASSVRFNGTSAGFVLNSATSISTTVPGGASTGPISVTTPGGSAVSTTNFAVIPVPVITSFAPSSGGVGTSVVISGGNFQGTTVVSFNGTSAPGYVVNGTGTQITVNVPSGASTGPISLTTGGGTAISASSFTVLATPTIVSFTPTGGTTGTTVTITGTNFTGTTNVSFNGASATFSGVTNTSITAQVPSGASTGPITVTAPGGTAASASNFVVNPAPAIASFTPSTGTAGTSVTITGTNFTGATSVAFNGVAASFTVASASSITATVPAGASTGPVTVTAPGGSGTSTGSFTVIPVTLTTQAAVCINSGTFALTGGSPAGGTYSGPGVSSNQFNPLTAGTGTHTITYSYTLNGVTSTATQPLTVNALPNVTLAAFGPRCQGSAAFTLTGGSPAGGSYSGVGVSGGQFSPSTAGVGTFTITYSYSDANGCAATATSTITVLPTPTFASTASQVCTGQPVTLTVSNAGPGATYLWSPGGQTTASITDSPTAATTYSVTVTNAAGCTYPFSQAVSINPAMTAPGVVGQLQPIDGANGLSLPLTFSWSPAGANALYDVYVWPTAGTQPATPVVSGINSLQYTYSGPIPYGADYKWRVVARNACFSTPGPVQTFGLRELPDLRVSFIQNPDTVYSGQTMQMAWNVTNIGAGSTLAQQWQDYVWLSQDSTFNPNTAVRVGAWGNTTFLQPNATYITNATFTVPYSQAGYYYVFVRTNSGPFASNGPLLETDYTNNLRRASKRTLMIVPQTPDFSLENFVSPPNFSVGYTDVTMRYRVYNRGSVAATQARYDEYFISPDTIQNIAQNTGRGALGPNAISLGRQLVRDTLLTNGFYARTVTVRIPHTEYGTRYFYSYTDTDNAIFETASTNNVNRPVPVEIILRPPADLTPILLTAPANMLAGTSTSVSWDVRNIGNNAPVPEERYWSDQFWLCQSATFDPATAIPVGALSVFNGDTLGVQHHYRRTVTLNIPNGLSGTYYVYGMADYVAGSARGNVFEYTYEGNNMRRSGVVNVTLTYADLQPTAFTGPTTIDAFQTFTLNYTVRNNSTAVGPANGTWTDAVWLVTPGGSIPINSVNCQSPIGTATHTGPLAVGASYSGSMTLTIPRYIDPGSYELVLRTDNGNQVYEYTFENNNDQRFAITYRYSDDLRLTALSTTGTAYSGQTIGLNYSVDNQGAFRTLATGWSDEFYLSTDAILDASDLRLTTVTRNGDLAIGANYTGTATVRLPHGLQGNFYVIGKTGVRDGRGYCSGTVSSVLVDTNPANNVRTSALPILLTPPCDLIPTAYTLPIDVVAGQQVTIPYTIRNQGVGTTLEGDWDDGVYLSTSPSVNGSVVRIGTFRHPGTLAAGASYSGSITATIPAYLSGNYYVFLVTDITPGANGYYPVQLWGGAVQYGVVYEHQQELNNVVQGSLLIRVPLPADLLVTSVTVPATRKLGQVMTVHYNVKNQGVNNAVGQLKDGLYLSQDAVVDGAVDQLFATQTRNVTITPNQTIPGVVRSRLQGIQPGSYHGLMATNLFNDIYEGLPSSPAANNNVTDAANRLAIDVDDLPLRTPTSFPLMKDSVVYYRVTPSANKDMVLTLTSNQSFGQNEMYVAYGRPPTPADYDFIYLNQVSTSQEILVPTTGPLPYYVLVKTPYVYPGLQTATLYADTLGFQVRSITANRVGRGRVTTQVLGAGFRRLRTGPTGYPATRFYLTKGSSPAIRAEAQVLKFRNSTEVTLRWRLDTLSVGVYNVVADNNGTRVQLTDGLTVEPARPLNVDFATIIPQTVRIGTNANWTYFLQNNSNVDVPYWEFQYELPPGQSPVITHTPNVRKKSDFTPGTAGSATPRNRMDDGLTEVLPFVATDLRPGEIIQVNLRLTPNRLGGLPVVWNQAALTEEWYTRQTLDFIDRYRAAVLAAPASYPAGVASLAANATAWQDSLRRYYVRAGLLDTAALRVGRLRTGYTATSASIAIPGGVCGNWGVTECVRPFRPNPFSANSYPAALVGCADSIVFTYKGRGVSCTQIVGSSDPNLIAGPTGAGRRKMVGAQQRLSYQVQFENDPHLATAPAQVVRVIVPLSAAYDPQQFRLGSFGWATYTFQAPANSSSYTSLLNMPDSLGYDVRVVGTVDVVGRRLIWQFETIDPATGVAPLDPNKGFLLLNDSTGRGQGFVNYTIKASPTAVTGDTLAAQASIVFDTNPPLATNRWKNVLDAVAPTSQLAALPATTPGATVPLSWTASDDTGGSGLLSYDLYASQDGGPFQPVAQNIATTSYAFTGQSNSRYDFFVLAQDTTNNREALKLVGDAYTVLGTALPDLVVSTNQTLAGGSYRNVTIMPGGTLHLTGGLTVTGTMSVGTGGTLDTHAASGCALVSGTGSFQLQAGATLRVCDPAGISRSGNTGSVQVDGSRTFSPDASYIYDGLQAQVTGPGLPAQVRYLGNVGQLLTLSQAVDIAQVLEANAAFNTGGMACTLLSSAQGTALVRYNDANAPTMTGNVTVQRYIDPASNPGAGYRHYSSPVINAPFSDLTTTRFTPTLNSAYNTAAQPGGVSPFPTVYGYDENRVATVGSNYGPFDKGWFSPSGNLVTGRGYTVNIPGTEKVDFVGQLYNSTLNLPLSFTPSAEPGWQLVGNPYAAPLDWSLVPRPAGLDAAMYVFTSTGQYAGSYRTYTNGVGDGSPIVPSSQGFFVRTTAATTLTIGNAARVTEFRTTDPTFQRGNDLRPKLELQLQAGTPEAPTGQPDAAYLYMQAGATNGVDAVYDAVKLANPSGLNLSSEGPATATALAINGLPVGSLASATVIPLHVAVPTSGTYTLSAASLLNLPANLDVVLIDVLSGQRTDLRLHPAYRFTAVATAPATGRFYLNLTPTVGPLATAPGLSAATVSVFPNPAHQTVTVLVPAVRGAATVQATLLSVLGQTVRQQQAALPATGTRLTLDVTGLATGMYMLRLQAGNETLTRRITVE
ncbi:IPT/TIG domain-containing protein [Hymenobacter rubidus]|uniref:IPT/TIG domain-containing protein n=1 Tax=Hymenobacter rubidus TaxID=1441626 RepID=UPI00191FEFC3|nr:IPT/TIG domain-containing protein [Hymenobacter rubidus]